MALCPLLCCQEGCLKPEETLYDSPMHMVAVGSTKSKTCHSLLSMSPVKLHVAYVLYCVVYRRPEEAHIYLYDDPMVTVGSTKSKTCQSLSETQFKTLRPSNHHRGR